MLTPDSNPLRQLTLEEFYFDVFVAEKNPAKAYAKQFEQAIKWMRRVLRRPPNVSDLKPEIYDYFVGSLIEMGLDPGYSRSVLGTRLITLWKFAEAKGAASVPCSPTRLARSGPKALPLPVGDPGTLVAMFRERYLPEVLQPDNCSPDGMWIALRDIRACFGRDLRLDELSAQILASYTAYLQKRSLKAITVRDKRSRLLSLWRFAAREGLAPPVPDVRPIRAPRNVPNAWSQEEFSRIVSASRKLPRTLHVGPVAAFKLWPAIILTCYYTALRRGSLVRLRHADLDLETAWLTVPGDVMKNRIGQKFHLGQDAIEAIRRIWNPAARDRLFPAPLKQGNMRILSNHFDRILAIAGVPKVPGEHACHFHKIRRTAVTLTAAIAGMPQAIALAGHSGADVNKRYIDPRFLPSHNATAWLPSPTTSGLLER